MRSTRCFSLTLLLAGLGLSSGVQAQVTGLPVHNAGITGGLTIGAEMGFPDADYGKGTGLGARGALGLGPFGVSAVISRWNPKGPAEAHTAVGGFLNLKVFGGPLIPLSVTLQGGAEYARLLFHGSIAGRGTQSQAALKRILQVANRERSHRDFCCWRRQQ